MIESLNLKKIIFDLDSTLLYISDDWVNSYQKVINKYNIKITSKEVYACVGDFDKNTEDIIVTNKMICDYVNEKLNINMEEKTLVELQKEYREISLLNSETIYDVLNYLSKKYEIIAYTNWNTKDQIYRLKKNNLDKFFSKIYGWDILPKKPSKRGLNTIIGNDNIKDYIMIGDNIKIDLEIPYSMGMNTIFLNTKNIVQKKYKEIKQIEELKIVL